jgi:hypothetical protein
MMFNQTGKRFNPIHFHFDMNRRKNQAATRRPNGREAEI